jgi:hypothetical protein
VWRPACPTPCGPSQGLETQQAALGVFEAWQARLAACRSAGSRLQPTAGLWQHPVVHHFTFIATELLSLLTLWWEDWLSGNHCCVLLGACLTAGCKGRFRSFLGWQVPVPSLGLVLDFS